MWITGVEPVRLGSGFEIDAIPTVTQRRRQRVAVASPLMQHIGEFGFDHPQPLVLDGGSILPTLPVAVVDQGNQAFARGKAAAMNLWREGFVHRSQRLIDAQCQRHRIAFAATARTPDVQTEQPGMVPGVADGQVHAAPERTGKINHEVGGNGVGVRFRAVTARAGDVADQAVEAGGIGLRRIAVCGHRRLVVLIVRRRRCVRWRIDIGDTAHSFAVQRHRLDDVLEFGQHVGLALR